MSKNKYLAIIIFCLSTLFIIGGLLWRNNVASKKRVQDNQSNSKIQTLGSATGSDSVLLGEPSRQQQKSGGLAVESDSGSSNLGQLIPSTGEQGSSQSTNNKSQPTPFDPSTFQQYDKYKDSTSGLFADVVKGTGTELTANKKAAVVYKGWLTQGQLFDESRKDDKGQLQPFVFTLGAQQVIQGWEQTLVGMKVGGVRLIIVPPAVGYGASGQGPIPPNSVLIFQVQLVAVE